MTQRRGGRSAERTLGSGGPDAQRSDSELAGCFKDGEGHPCPAGPLGLVSGRVTGGGKPLDWEVEFYRLDPPSGYYIDLRASCDSTGRYSMVVPVGDYFLLVAPAQDPDYI